MDYRVHITEKALKDLAIILGYIAEDDEEAAARLGNTLLDHIELLTRFPKLGESIPARPRVRKLVHSPLVVYYQIREARRIIEILHLRHAARKLPRI